MGALIISKGSVAPWNAKLVPPVTRGLEYWGTFDTDARRFAFNRAIGKADARIVGVPEAFPTHGRFRGLQNFLQTSVPETAEITLIALCKSGIAIPEGSSSTGDDNTPLYIGNYRGNAITPGITGTAYGASLYAVAQGSITGAAARDNLAGGATSSARSIVDATEIATQWGIRAVRASDSLVSKVDNFTTGKSAIGTSSVRRVLSDSLFRVGSGTAVFGGVADISAVAIFSVYLTDTEIALTVEAMKKRGQRLGILT